MPNARKHVLARYKKARKAGKTPLQHGALCYRHTKKGLRILLVSSRRTRRWISPKGWPMTGRTPHETAAREAWEEAGVKGIPNPQALGFYSYLKYINPKLTITCTVQLFALEVREQMVSFPEKGERKTRWMKPRKAAKRVLEPELKRLILRFAESERQRIASDA